jgi:hypothetical protein
MAIEERPERLAEVLDVLAKLNERFHGRFTLRDRPIRERYLDAQLALPSAVT